MRPIFLAIAVAAVGLSACGEPTPSSPPAPPPPEYASNWFVAVSSKPGGALNIHETKLGFGGFMREPDGAFQPIRNIVLTDAAMSFIAPTLDASLTATKAADGSWAGEWTADGTTTDLIFKPSGALEMTETFVKLPDGRWIQFQCLGAGSPTVIFDYGAGGAMASWKDVFEPISQTTRACMAERAARGLSDPGPIPRDVNAAAADINAFVHAARIEGPLVLVGHSMASYHVRQYANLHKDGEVAGMVLVDPSGDGQTARFTEFIPNLAELLGDNVDDEVAAGCVKALHEKLLKRDEPVAKTCGGNDPDRVEATLSEVASMEVVSTNQIKAAARSYGDMPLIVLTRGDYKKGMPAAFTAENTAAMERVWTAMHIEMTALSTIGEHRVVDGAGHSIQRDQPQAVIGAVNEVITKARERAAKP